MAIITDEMKRKAQEAFDNKTDSYNCFATGNTYAVKEDLKSYGFIWCAEDKSWTIEYTSEWDKFIYERKVADGKWAGVILEFRKAEQIVTEEMLSDFEKDLEKQEDKP